MCRPAVREKILSHETLSAQLIFFAHPELNQTRVGTSGTAAHFRDLEGGIEKLEKATSGAGASLSEKDLAPTDILANEPRERVEARQGSIASQGLREQFGFMSLKDWPGFFSSKDF